jgi:hypothetical protein
MAAIAAGRAAQIGLQLLPALQKAATSTTIKSKEIFGYDFVGLVFKLFLYYTVAYIIAKYMEFVISGSGFFKNFAMLFGISLPSLFPKQFEQLFTDGYSQYKLKYWDFVKAISIVIVAYEGYNYYRTNKAAGAHVDIITVALFGLIEGFLVMITAPEIIARVQAKGLEMGFFAEPVFNTPKESAKQGETVFIELRGALPSTGVLYGWKELSFEQEFTTTPEGNLGTEVKILETTPPGLYTVYFDQRPFGGGYVQKRFTVLRASATATAFDDSLGGSA